MEKLKLYQGRYGYGFDDEKPVVIESEIPPVIIYNHREDDGKRVDKREIYLIQQEGKLLLVERKAFWVRKKWYPEGESKIKFYQLPEFEAGE